MNKIVKIILIILAIIVLLFVLLTIFGIYLSLKNPQDIQDNPALISIEKYGNEYPYTIDNLTLKCDNQAVWVEDTVLNKYALNGIAYSKLQSLPDFKGYSTEIIIKGKSDFDFLNKGLEFCK